MKLNIKISITCGKKACNPSISNMCRFVCGVNSDKPYCVLFMKGLLGHRVFGRGYSYKQYQRCDECREAQND